MHNINISKGKRQMRNWFVMGLKSFLLKHKNKPVKNANDLKYSLKDFLLRKNKRLWQFNFNFK